MELKMVFVPPLYIPKDNPKNPNGDDANFVSTESQTIGVADGVGGCWARNVDPGKYSRQLMSHAKSAAEKHRGGPVDPMAILSEAHSKTTAEGSSTACIVTHSGGGFLRAANVGDSGFMVLRNNRVVFKSESQQWSFNHPYQLSRVGGEKHGPGIGAEIETSVEENDVIVLGTDGFWDNVFPSDVEVILESIGGNDNKVVDLDGFLNAATNMACCNSQFVSKETPFSLASNHQGGKPDDITLIVA